MIKFKFCFLSFMGTYLEGRLCESSTNFSRTVYNRDIQELAQNGVQ